MSQAFLAALDNIPDASRAAVAKAAQTMIRDELKLRREKVKARAAKTRQSAPVKPTPVKARKPVAVAVAPVKRRTRKPAAIPVAA